MIIALANNVDYAQNNNISVEVYDKLEVKSRVIAKIK